MKFVVEFGLDNDWKINDEMIGWNMMKLMTVLWRNLNVLDPLIVDCLYLVESYVVFSNVVDENNIDNKEL
jgi:hypothetical protein